MAVWSFACKNESSSNRWFDGTDQHFYLEDVAAFGYDKNIIDSMSMLEDHRKGYVKNISQIRRGIGTSLFNGIMFNQMTSKLSDFSDAVFMEDTVFIDSTKRYLRIGDSFELIDSVGKDVLSNNNDIVGLFETLGIQSGNDQVVAETAVLIEKFSAQMSKTFTGDSFGFVEDVNVGIVGKHLRDNIVIKEAIEKNVENVVGDESKVNPLGHMMFNESMFNGESDETSINTVIGLIDEVQIILT